MNILEERTVQLLLKHRRLTAMYVGLYLWGYDKRQRQANGEHIVMTHGNPQRYCLAAGRVLQRMKAKGLVFDVMNETVGSHFWAARISDLFV